MVLDYTLRNFVQARNHTSTNVNVSQDDTIDCDIKSQDSVHLSSIENYAHRVIREIMIHLNQNRRNQKNDSGIDGGIKNHLDQNNQNHLLWFHQNHLLLLVNFYQLRKSQTCVTTLWTWNLITWSILHQLSYQMCL